MILQVFYSVFSGLLLALAIPNELYLLGFPFFTLFALVPYYLAIKSAENYRKAFLFGFLQSTTTHIASSFWLAYFKNYALVTLGASAAGTGLFGGLAGILLFLPYSKQKNRNFLNDYSAFKKFTDSSLFRILFFTFGYTIYEFVKSNGFLGYPWGTIPAAMYNWPIIMQIAAITGIHGITFVISLFNAILAEVFILYCSSEIKFERDRKASIIVAGRLFAVIFGCIFIYGVYQCDLKRVPDRFVSTIIVQRNSDPWDEATDSESVLRSQELTYSQYKKLLEENKKPDLVVWSEGSLSYAFPNHQKHYERSPINKPLTEFIKEINTPLVTGGSWIKSWENKQYHNAALVFDKEGKFRGYYGKNHLVPCAEAIPFMDYPIVRNFMEKIIHISAGWTPGDQYVYFDIPCSYNPERILPAVAEYNLSTSWEVQKNLENQAPTVKISTPVCFDDCFPDIMRPLFLNGSEVFMNITNDSWSLKKSSEYQHFVNASYSAIEYRTTLVRATNGGYSVVVDPTGKILADLPLFESDSMAYDVPVYNRTMTTFARFGNWFPSIVIFVVIIYCIYMILEMPQPDYFPSERKIKSKKNKKHHRK